MQAYTVEQVAKMLNISRDKVYYLLRTRQLRSIKIGKSRRITDQHLADFIASLEDHHAAESTSRRTAVATAKSGAISACGLATAAARNAGSTRGFPNIPLE